MTHGRGAASIAREGKFENATDAKRFIRSKTKLLGLKQTTPNLDSLNEVAAGLQRLEDKGLEVPDEVRMADLRGYAEGFWNPKHPRRVNINSRMDSERFRNLAEAGSFAGDYRGAILVHEVGHFNHLKDGMRPMRLFSLAKTRAVRKEVSEYAGTMNLEFVAETFTGMVGGKKYNNKIMKWYNDEGGPKVS